VSQYQKKHSPTHIVFINHPLSASSIYYYPWHPLCSIYMPDCLFPQSLYKFSLVYLFTWNPALHTPCISSPSYCFAVVLRLCHLILVSLSILYLKLYLLLSTQLLYNLPLSINDISLLVSNGTNCVNLFHPI